METTLPAWALVNFETVRAYLQEPEKYDDVLKRFVRNVTGRIETYCQRKLKSRAYTGADAFVLDGKDTRRITLPQWPLTTLTSCKALDNNGAPWTLDITGARKLPGGIIELTNDFFPAGGGNVVVEATCGYVSGTHDGELFTLEQASLRLIQVWWQDFLNQVGRGIEVTEGGSTVKLVDGDLPADVREMLTPFRRP